MYSIAILTYEEIETEIATGIEIGNANGIETEALIVITRTQNLQTRVQRGTNRLVVRLSKQLGRSASPL